MGKKCVAMRYGVRESRPSSLGFVRPHPGCAQSCRAVVFVLSPLGSCSCFSYPFSLVSWDREGIVLVNVVLPAVSRFRRVVGYSNTGYNYLPTIMGGRDTVRMYVSDHYAVRVVLVDDSIDIDTR